MSNSIFKQLKDIADIEVIAWNNINKETCIKAAENWSVSGATVDAHGDDLVVDAARYIVDVLKNNVSGIR